MDKQQTQYLLIPKWKWKMFFNCCFFPKSECPDIWIRLPRHKWPKSWSSIEGPVVLLERNLYGHPLAGLLWGRQFEKILLKHGGEKIPNWECLFVLPHYGLFLSVYVDVRNLAGKKQNIDPMWKVLNKEVDLGEPTSFFDQCILGMHSKTMWNKQGYCGQLQNHVWIANFRGRKRTASILWESSYLFMILWYGRSCKEMCEAKLWVSKQDDATTLHGIYSVHRWPLLQRRRNEICWKICTSMLSNCSIMFLLGTNWKARYSMVNEQTCTIHHKMDQSMWQTPESIDFIYSSYMWIQTILSRG